MLARQSPRDGCIPARYGWGRRPGRWLEQLRALGERPRVDGVGLGPLEESLGEMVGSGSG